MPVLPGHLMHQDPEFNHNEHDYISTACWHYMHPRCRQTCKFCTSPCQCDCHKTRDDHA